MSKSVMLALALTLLVALDFFLNVVAYDLLWEMGLMFASFAKGAWDWFFTLIQSLKFYDLLWLALVPRIKFFFLVDIWKRVFIKGIAPIIFLDTKNRRLVTSRIGLLVTLVKGMVQAARLAIYTRLENWCGRFAGAVLAVVLGLAIFGVVYMSYGVWLVVGFIPIPRWISSRLFSVVRYLDSFSRKFLFRMAMILGLMKVVGFFSKLVPRKIIQFFLRVRRRAVRLLIRRRRQTNNRLRRVSRWERATASWLAFWDTVFKRVDAQAREYEQQQKKNTDGA